MVGRERSSINLVSVVRCRTSCPLRVRLAVARPPMPYPRTYMLLYKCTQELPLLAYLLEVGGRGRGTKGLGRYVEHIGITYIPTYLPTYM